MARREAGGELSGRACICFFYSAPASSLGLELEASFSTAVQMAVAKVARKRSKSMQVLFWSLLTAGR